MSDSPAEISPAPHHAAAAEAWRPTPFATIWAAQAGSLLGSQAAQFALVWWLTLETGSGRVLATAALLALSPAVLLGPLAGAVVDRTSRKRVMLAADAVAAGAAAALALLFHVGAVDVVHVLAVLLVRGVALTFHEPAWTAATTLMVPKRLLGRVQGANQMLDAGVGLIAPPLGALLLGLLPIAVIFGIDVLSAFVAMAALGLSRVPDPAPRREARASSLIDGVREGVALVGAQQGLTALVAIAAAINLLLTPAFAMLPLLVSEHFGGSALQLAGLTALVAAGTLCGGAALAAHARLASSVTTALWSLAAMGLATLAIGAAPADAPWLAAAGLFAVGACAALVNGPIHAVLQAVVDPACQGRVFTLLGSLSAAAAPLGLLFAGPLVDALGVRTLYVAAGATCCAASVLGTRSPAAGFGGEWPSPEAPRRASLDP